MQARFIRAEEPPGCVRILKRFWEETMEDAPCDQIGDVRGPMLLRLCMNTATVKEIYEKEAAQTLSYTKVIKLGVVAAVNEGF
jgi:hypothetical protein